MARPPTLREQLHDITNLDLDKRFKPKHGCKDCVYVEISYDYDKDKGNIEISICSKYKYIVHREIGNEYNFPICDDHPMLIKCIFCEHVCFKDMQKCPNCQTELLATQFPQPSQPPAKVETRLFSPISPNEYNRSPEYSKKIERRDAIGNAIDNTKTSLKIHAKTILSNKTFLFVLLCIAADLCFNLFMVFDWMIPLWLLFSGIWGYVIIKEYMKSNRGVESKITQMLCFSTVLGIVMMIIFLPLYP